MTSDPTLVTLVTIIAAIWLVACALAVVVFWSWGEGRRKGPR